jgi:alpha-tubulin suppressor-like RCC1 family protein
VVTPYIGATPQSPVVFGSTLTTQTVTGLTNGVSYAFTVAATNAVGTGPESDLSNVVTPATVPGAPTIGVATAGNAEATVSWTAPVSDGGSALTGYVVTPYIGATPQSPVVFGSTLTTQTVTGLTNGVSYAFTVAATNAVGTGPESDLSNVVTPAAPVANIAAGGAHTCAQLDPGTVRCWGSNSNGQLGDGTTTSSPSPVTVTGISTATSVAAGATHTCAVLADGTVSCWGRNNFGQLGDGTTVDSSTPVTVSGITAATAINAGGDFTCALLSDGTLQCWGRNNQGQLGTGSLTPASSSTPAAVAGVTNATSVSAGSMHSCAGLSDGTLRCWGRNNQGQLGNGTMSANSPSAVTVTGISTATTVDVGGNASCALLADSTLRCWGANGDGQLGDGTMVNSSLPVAVSGISTATSVTAAGTHTCALLSDGTVSCWGANGNGQRGDGTTTGSLSPVTVTGVAGAVAVTADSGTVTCVLLADGTVKCTGLNASGQLGDGTTTSSTTPVNVVGL